MGLMPIIFTMLTIFAISVIVILSVSYLLFKMRKTNDKPVIKQRKYPVAVSNEIRVRESVPNNIEQQPVAIRYTQASQYNNSRRFEVLNFQATENIVPSVLNNKPYYFPTKKGFNIYENYSEVI